MVKLQVFDLETFIKKADIHNDVCVAFHDRGSGGEIYTYIVVTNLIDPGPQRTPYILYYEEYFDNAWILQSDKKRQKELDQRTKEIEDALKKKGFRVVAGVWQD